MEEKRPHLISVNALIIFMTRSKKHPLPFLPFSTMEIIQATGAVRAVIPVFLSNSDLPCETD